MQQLETGTLFDLRVPSSPDSLTLVRALVQRALEATGCSTGTSQKVVVAVNEACMNVIQHAYHGDSSGEFRLVLRQSDGKLYFRLTDQAEYIDLAMVKSRDLDDIRPGGLGVHFISEIMDGYRIGHLEGGRGNYVEMDKIIE